MSELPVDDSQSRAVPSRLDALIVVGAGPTGIGIVHRTSHITSVTLVDPDPAAFDLWDEHELDGVHKVVGDATSRLVLDEAGISQAFAVVAATSEDDVNIETCRLAVEADVPEVLCRLTDPGRREEVMAIGAQPVTAPMAMAGALTARLPGVAVTTSEVGLGEGEILQVRVMPGSLVIGRPIAEIATREYLVAAIYRDGELVVPHGDTKVQAHDQVLLVGEPDTLRAIADYFRLGAARFPHQFGRSIVVCDRGETTEREARWLADLADIRSLYRVETASSPPGGADDMTPILVPRSGDPLPALWDVHPGLYVIDPPGRGFWKRCTNTVAALLAREKRPMLIARGSSPWNRILVPVTDSPTSWRGLELAVDIARLVGAQITALHVSQPRFLAGSLGEERTAAVERAVADVARLYDVEFAVQVEEGNSIVTAAKIAGDHDLVVTARRPGQRDSYFRPDVGLRIADAVPCSAVLLNSELS